jgi:purine-binding chemotaxis protein CheW
MLQLNNERYALPATAMREISRWRAPTPVPGAPGVLPGLITQRGLVLPVVHLVRVLGLPETPPGRDTRYLIAHHNDIEMALMVDMVIDLVDLPDTALETLPATLNPQQARLLHAIARVDAQPVALIDLAAVVGAVQGEA